MVELNIQYIHYSDTVTKERSLNKFMVSLNKCVVSLNKCVVSLNKLVVALLCELLIYIYCIFIALNQGNTRLASPNVSCDPKNQTNS